MKIIHGWKGLAEADRGAAVALGNFDGVHLGHQRVIADAREAARALGAPLGVISFEPHARMHFQPDAPPFRLMNAHQLARTVQALGADRLYLLPFGVEMASFTDHDFVRDVLVAGLGARHVAVGFDTTFGKGRTGDPDSMKRYGAEFGFGVTVAGAVENAA
jgi:riboflavin kinase/FMN adenylyltransferase